MRGAEDALGDAIGEDFTAIVDMHEAGEDKAVFIGAEGAHAGGELRGEHGDGAVGEVDAGAAEAGFEVEVGSGADVVADVGDVDLEVPGAVGVWGDVDGVIEVAGGLAVNGDDGEVAEVFALAQLGFGKGGYGLLGGGGGFGEDVGGEDVGDVVLADDDLDIDSEGVGGGRGFR